MKERHQVHTARQFSRERCTPTSDAAASALRRAGRGTAFALTVVRGLAAWLMDERGEFDYVNPSGRDDWMGCSPEANDQRGRHRQLLRPCRSARVLLLPLCFPALLVVVALTSVFPRNLLDQILAWFGWFTPPDVLQIIRAQIQLITKSGCFRARWHSGIGETPDSKRAR